ncbi:hypothetical protein DEV92_1237 [Phyllobacterium myrsinacearum]|uniref:Uncharacterized protein n=1 Tax=Phyllobacterium myrsinacearum TaxID=28101 RepID=A0A2S9J9R1_9HYPH|nr:hypothetical protein C5750_26005 [Phyllobacterium myrsinacearum]PWV83462.1 hypothetical protein DEV92_1237 [Phyllobacterium myrsinacearum]RZU96802.1 hypothetical protein EV654_5236 [Phyllobacterium myrsinacearum]
MNRQSTQRRAVFLRNRLLLPRGIGIRSLARSLLGLTVIFAFFFGPLILTVVLTPQQTEQPKDNRTPCLQNLPGFAFERCRH